MLNSVQYSYTMYIKVHHVHLQQVRNRSLSNHGNFDRVSELLKFKAFLYFRATCNEFKSSTG